MSSGVPAADIRGVIVVGLVAGFLERQEGVGDGDQVRWRGVEQVRDRVRHGLTSGTADGPLTDGLDLGVHVPAAHGMAVSLAIGTRADRSSSRLADQLMEERVVGRGDRAAKVHRPRAAGTGVATSEQLGEVEKLLAADRPPHRSKSLDSLRDSASSAAGSSSFSAASLSAMSVRYTHSDRPSFHASSRARRSMRRTVSTGQVSRP